MSFDALCEMLWETAFESAIGALMVMIMGGIAIGIVGGIFGDMNPHLPPALAGAKPVTTIPHSFIGLQNFFHQYQYAIIFSVLFLAKLVGRLARYSTLEKHRETAAWLGGFSERISEDWLGLIVINAFNAWITALILSWLQNFSWTHFLWALAMEALQPLFHFLFGWVPANPFFDLLGSTWGWYNDNQFKFTFWLIYTAAICDDLGIPNIKTLSRIVWLRLTTPRTARIEVAKD